MPTYTLADAANPAIVRAALDAALVSGKSRPRVTFGLTPHPAHISASVGVDGTWTVVRPSGYLFRLTTDQAVAAIVAARTGRN